MAAATFIKLIQVGGSAIHVRADHVTAVGVGQAKFGDPPLTVVFVMGIEKPIYVKEAPETVMRMVENLR